MGRPVATTAGSLLERRGLGAEHSPQPLAIGSFVRLLRLIFAIGCGRWHNVRRNAGEEGSCCASVVDSDPEGRDSFCLPESPSDTAPVIHRFEFVTLAFDRRQTVFDLPRWRWPTIGPYNGFDGAARIRAWQLVRFYELNGWLRYPQACSVTGREGEMALHQEDYWRPWDAYPVSRRAHLLIHTRDRYPDKWAAFLFGEALPDTWAHSLSANDTQTAKRCTVADLLAHAPHPVGVTVPVGQFRVEQRRSPLSR